MLAALADILVNRHQILPFDLLLNMQKARPADNAGDLPAQTGHHSSPGRCRSPQPSLFPGFRGVQASKEEVSPCKKEKRSCWYLVFWPAVCPEVPEAVTWTLQHCATTTCPSRT